MIDERYDRDYGIAANLHAEKWRPITAAWEIARNLRIIADYLDAGNLNEGVLAALAPYAGHNPPGVVSATEANKLRLVADSIEAAAPLPSPVTDEQRKQVYESEVDLCKEMKARDTADLLLDQCTEADWAERADEIAMCDNPTEWLGLNLPVIEE